MYEARNCKSVFKSGENEPAREQFTQTWIALINQIEQSKAILAGIR